MSPVISLFGWYSIWRLTVWLLCVANVYIRYFQLVMMLMLWSWSSGVVKSGSTLTGHWCQRWYFVGFKLTAVHSQTIFNAISVWCPKVITLALKNLFHVCLSVMCIYPWYNLPIFLLLSVTGPKLISKLVQQWCVVLCSHHHAIWLIACHEWDPEREPKSIKIERRWWNKHRSSSITPWYK